MTTAVESLQVPDTIAATLAGVSRATWWRLHAAGKTPAPVKLGRKVLWIKSEIEFWVQNRCPPRADLEAMLAQSRRLRIVS